MEQEPRSAQAGEFDSVTAPVETAETSKETNSLALNDVETGGTIKETIGLESEGTDKNTILNRELDQKKVESNFFERIDEKLSNSSNEKTKARSIENSHLQKPKKKKRRKQSSALGGSLQALLHADTSDEHSSLSNSPNLSYYSDEVVLEEHATKKTRKRKFKNSELSKSREKYRLYINDEAEEDEDDGNFLGDIERSNHVGADSYSSDEEENEDEDGYDELKDFIADEFEEDGIDDQLVYNGPHLKLHKDDFREGNLPTLNENIENHQSSDEDEDDDDDEILRGGIEEDDLALIEENTGVRLRKDSQKHRLKKVSEFHDSSNQTLVGRDIGDLEDLLFNTGADNDEVQVPHQQNRVYTTNFDSEHDDEDDWMVDDMDEKDLKGDEFNIIQSVFGDYDTVMDILMNKVHKPKENLSAGDAFEKSQSKTLEELRLNAEHDTIGDNFEVSFGTVNGKEEGEVEHIQDQMKKTTLNTLRSIAEPDELQGQFLTDFDTEAKQVDIPERLYLLYNERWRLLKDQKIVKEELQTEASWITQKFLQTYPELFKEDLIRRTHSLEYKSSFPYNSGGVFQILSSAIFSVLDWLLNQRLDIPYIYSHRMHLIQPPLNDFLIGKIVFLDSVYYKLKISMESFYLRLKNYRESESIAKYTNISESQELLDDDAISMYLSISGLDEAIAMCLNFESTRDVDQIRLYIMYHIDTPRFRQMKQGVKGDQLTNQNDIQTNIGSSTRKQRRNFITELFEYIETHKLYDIWNSHIVSPYILSLYLKSFTSPQFHCSVPTSSTCGLPSTFSLLPPGGPVLENSKSALHKWFEKYIKSDSRYFMNTEKIIESLVIYESKRLATFPTIRSKIYKYFLSNACVTTVTTVKGERTLSPNNTCWLAKRLFRKPINTLFPGTYLYVNEEFHDSASNFNALFDGCLSSEIFELEKHGLIDIVIHPLCIDDDAPWRGSDGENRIKERFLHEIGLLNSGIESNSSSGLKGPLPTPIFNRFEQEMRMFRNSDNIDNRIVRKILEELKYGYVSISGSIWSKLIQIPILHRLIEKELFPTFRQDILNYMKSRSEEYIAELCSLNLQKRLRILPPRPPSIRDSSTEDNQGRRSNKNEYIMEELASDDDDFISNRYIGKDVSRENENDYQFKKDYNTNWGLKIISCVVDKAENGFKVCVTALDIFGELRDYLILDHLLTGNLHKSLKTGHQNERDLTSLDSQRFEEDLDNLIKFTKTYYPHYVCIGISDRKSLDLGNLWSNMILKKVRRKDLDYVSNIYFVSMDVSRALVRRINSSGSDPKTKGFKMKGLHSDYPISVHLAISVGRLVQNPLAEQLQLWEDTNNEVERELSLNHFSLDAANKSNISNLIGAKNGFNSITCLRLHRFQNTVDSKLLQFHLLMAIRSVVSNLGVQLNRMKGHPHLQSPLKFVSGLGPRKARTLAFYIDSLSEPIHNRSQLKISEDANLNLNSRDEIYDDEYAEANRKNTGCLTKNVFLNSEIFLRVDEESIYEREFNKNLNIFDISRLSDIEDRELVLTILGNVKDQISEENNSGTRQKIKEKDETLYWSWISRRSSMLETLDLEAYAKLMYENQDRPKLLPYLNKMLRELKKPYDCSYFAKEFKGIEKSRQFRETMEINKEDLFIGCEITCRITGTLVNNRPHSSSRCPISLWFDQYNMKVIVEDFDMFWEEVLDENPRFQSVPLESVFKANTPLQVIVSNIEFSQQCVFVLMSQGKICSNLNYLLDNIWRQQQYRIELMEKHRHEGPSSSATSNKDLVTNKEYNRNDFNLLKDDLSCLTWTDIRHFSYILFKKNLNVITNSSGIDLNSNKTGRGYTNKEGHLKVFESKNMRNFAGSIHRTIHHPNYRNWSHEEILDHMKNENVPLGEVIIKSSNKHVDKLNMYVKVCEHPFMFKVINIDEFDQRLPGELGRRLRIDDTEFNDIDQILIQYVHPLKVHLSNIYSHSKYRVNMEYQTLVTELLVESTRSGNSIVWGIVVDKQIPCRFHLISVPPNTRVGSSGARIHFEDGIYVNYKGFQLWRKSENTLRKLLNWWKTDGFFKRTQHLEDYKRYKEFMVKQKQGRGADELSQKRISVYNGVNNSANQSARYFHENHHQVYRGDGGTFSYNHSYPNNASNNSYHYGGGGFRKSFHGYPPR